MVVIGVEVNNQRLPLYGQINTTTCYKAFMNYCIENFGLRIRNSNLLHQHFKFDQNDPTFLRDIDYKRIVGHNHIFYSTHNGTPQKIRYMEEIADILAINLRLITDHEEV